MMSALNQVTAEQPQKCEIVKAMDVPYAEYIHMMNDCDVLLDQLYSYTPAMNGLLALAKGMILVGGGEPENYEILGEKELRPIVNVLPNVEDVYAKLKDLVDAPEQIPQRCKEGIEYISRHHDHIKVAKQYLEFYQNLK
jgi:glycosyltransferase involved in cell wall biosynthesis